MPRIRTHKVESQLPGYSLDGLSNRDIFLAESNGVLIYFEDENWEEFYLRLLRYLGLDGGIETVFCLGGKGQLCKKMKEEPEAGRRRVFVFDKDFDDLLGQVRGGDGVVYLGRYSIENYFAERGLFLEFALTQKKSARTGDVNQALSNLVVERFLDWYRPVCRYFVVAQRYRFDLPTTKQGIKDIAELPGWTRNEAWWGKFLQNFNRRLTEKAAHLLERDRLHSELENAFNPVPRCAGVADGSQDCHLPGKHLIDCYLGLLEGAGFLPEIDDARYAFMMHSVPLLSMEVAEALRERLSAVI